MKRLSLLLLFSIVILLPCKGQEIKESPFEKMLQDCPDFQITKYKVDPYINAAKYLQKKGKSKGIALLKAFASTRKYESEIIVLCRMLFTESSGDEFRRPLIGGAMFIGKATYDVSKREPIEIVNGIPFLIVNGYILGGQPESALSYVEYCEKDCDWNNSYYYTVPTTKQKKDALNQILQSKIWGVKLSQTEQKFLEDQL